MPFPEDIPPQTLKFAKIAQWTGVTLAAASLALLIYWFVINGN